MRALTSLGRLLRRMSAPQDAQRRVHLSSLESANDPDIGKREGTPLIGASGSLLWSMVSGWFWIEVCVVGLLEPRLSDSELNED